MEKYFSGKIFKMLSLLLIFNLISLEDSVAQKKTLIRGEYKIRLKYKKKQLISFSCIDLRKSFYKRYKEKEICSLFWSKGEIRLENSNNYCNGSVGYNFRFDTLFRVYEASLFSSWSNHIYTEYLARKYDGLDTLPYICYNHSFLNNPQEEKVSWLCDKEFKWLYIVERELKIRSEYYEKNYNKIIYGDWTFGRKMDDFVKFWSTEK